MANNPNATPGVALSDDCQFLYNVLRGHNELTLNEILRLSFQIRGCGLTVHSRASDLRIKYGIAVFWYTRPGQRRGDASVYSLSAPVCEMVSKNGPVKSAKAPISAILSTIAVKPSALPLREVRRLRRRKPVDPRQFQFDLI